MGKGKDFLWLGSLFTEAVERKVRKEREERKKGTEENVSWKTDY